MKNYSYGWQIKERATNEIPVTEYTQAQFDMYNYVNGVLSKAIEYANCGWRGVTYKVMSFGNDTREYMILFGNGDFNNGYNSSRWIPIDGNSKGCNFSVLGENLW